MMHALMHALMHASSILKGMHPSIRMPWDSPSPTVARSIASEMARKIVCGDIAPGYLLTEMNLAAEFEASRTPAREAMLQLQAWGLATLQPKKGGVVTALSGAEAQDLINLRLMWETNALEYVSRETLRRHELAERLRFNLRQQRDALAVDDALAFAVADVAFHLCIIKAGGNRIVGELMDGLGPRFARLIHAAIAGDVDAARGFFSDHELLTDLVADEGTVEFGPAVRAHLEHGHATRPGY